MNLHRVSLDMVRTASALFLLGSLAATAQVSLGSASSFAVLGASTVTNTGSSTVTGNLGLSPGSALTGFPPGVVTGTIHVADGVAVQAQTDAASAFNTIAGLPCAFDLTGQDLGGLTLVPGIYCFTSTAQLTGALALDALGNPAAEWIFKIGSTLTTASGSSVTVINGGSACNVYWSVGSSATLGSTTAFAGNILAAASVTLTTGADVSGRAIALNGAVTMDSNDVGLPPECQCNGAASVVDLGPGCGTPAAPVLSSSPPGLGQTASLSIISVFPSTMLMVYLSDCGATPFVIPPTSCTVYVDLPSLQMIWMDMTDASGNWTVNVAIPADPAFLGSCFVVQAVVWATTGPLAGDNVTNGLQVTIGCP